MARLFLFFGPCGLPCSCGRRGCSRSCFYCGGALRPARGARRVPHGQRWATTTTQACRRTAPALPALAAPPALPGAP